MGAQESSGGIVLSPIKVIVNSPTQSLPKVKKGDGAFEDTMFLIDVMRQKKEKEIRALKEKRIYEMAQEQKRRNEAKDSSSRRIYRK